MTHHLEDRSSIRDVKPVDSYPPARMLWCYRSSTLRPSFHFYRFAVTYEARTKTMLQVVRLGFAWLTVALFLLFGSSWLTEPIAPITAAVLFVWLFATMVWS